MKFGTSPEVIAGGFTRLDGAIEFYSRVHSLIPPDAIILNFGAGRGERGIEDPIDFRRRLYDLRAVDRTVIGVDIDPIVSTNPLVNEAHILTNERLPLPDSSVDMVVAEWVFEHVDNPRAVSKELARVLKPGGWICARTPNRYGYIGIGARIVPNRIHTSVLKRSQPHRKAIDVFPTRYRMNTKYRLRKLFPSPCFTHATYCPIIDPPYFGRSRILITLVRGLSRLQPESLGPLLCVFIKKNDLD